MRVTGERGRKAERDGKEKMHTIGAFPPKGSTRLFYREGRKEYQGGYRDPKTGHSWR